MLNIYVFLFIVVFIVSILVGNDTITVDTGSLIDIVPIFLTFIYHALNFHTTFTLVVLVLIITAVITILAIILGVGIGELTK